MYAFEFPLSIYIVNFYNISKRWNLVAISISYKVQVFSKRWFLFSTTKRHGLIESNHIYNTANSFFLFTISIKMKQVCKKMYTYNLTQRKTELFGSCYRRNKTKLGGRCRFIRALSLSMYDQSMSLRTEMSIYFCSFYCILSLMVHVIFFLLFTLTQQRA